MAGEDPETVLIKQRTGLSRPYVMWISFLPVWMSYIEFVIDIDIVNAVVIGASIVQEDVSGAKMSAHEPIIFA